MRSTRFVESDLAKRIAAFGSFLLVYGYLIRDISVGRLYAFGDLPPFYGERAFDVFLSTWHFQQLGYPHLYPALPAYLGVATLVGGPVGQNLFYLLLVPAAFVSFVVFARRFVDEGPALYLAAGLYALNPITIGEFVNGGANEFLVLVGIPVVIHYLWDVVEKDSWRSALKAGAVFGATSLIPWTAFWTVLPFATYLLYRGRRSISRMGKLVSAGVLGVVLSLPSTYYIFQRSSTLQSTGVLFGQVSWNYAEADVLSLVRLAGNHGSLGMTELGYNSEPTMVVGLVIPVVAAFAWGDKRVRFMYPTIAALVAFMVLTRYTHTYPLFELFPPLFSLRNPTKLLYPLLIATSVLFGSGLEVFLGSGWRSHRDAVVRYGLVFVVVVPLFAYVAPASGALGLQETRDDDYYVPEDYHELASALDGKVLWVPYSYTTQLRLRHAYPDHVGVKSGGLVQGKPNSGYVTALFEDFAAGRDVGNRLADLGVRYVVVESRSQRRYPAAEGAPRVSRLHGAPWLFGEPTAFNRMLGESPRYREVRSTEHFTVYRVVGVESTERFERHRGLHAVVYPTEPDVERLGENLVTNGDFERGLEGWWSWSGEDGTQATAVNRSDGRAVELVTRTGDRYPLAQLVSVRRGVPYELDVVAEGSGTVNLYWYDGPKSSENLVARESYAFDEVPTTVDARGDRVSIRVLPDSERLIVDRVSLLRTTYPGQTGVSANAAGIPGVVVDGRSGQPASATVVAVNLDEHEAANANADVLVVDAETVLDGPLVFEPTYRQGVAVRTSEDRLPPDVPDDASVVTHETPNGTVVDYWVVGEFDDTPVTVLRTSYDDRWQGPPGSEHFRAYGWANGFTNAAPDEIRWGGSSIRRWVLLAWGVAWYLTLVLLAEPTIFRMWRRRRRAMEKLRVSMTRLTGPRSRL